jgi:hypothetical protein
MQQRGIGREHTAGSLEIGASFPTGAFCLAEFPTLAIGGGGARRRSIADQPLSLPSTAPTS